MKRLSLLAAVLIASTSLFACSKENNEPGVEVSEETGVAQAIINEYNEKQFIQMPLEISDKEAKEVYHIDDECIEEYGISLSGIQPGSGFALIVKAKDGKLEEAKNIVIQVKQDRIANAFYPMEQESAENAEVIEKGNYLALLILSDDYKEEALEIFQNSIK